MIELFQGVHNYFNGMKIKSWNPGALIKNGPLYSVTMRNRDPHR